MCKLEEQKKVLYNLICDSLYVPMKAKEIAILLNISKERRGELQDVLDLLVDEGKIDVTSRGKYVKASSERFIGTFIAHEKGFGFVELEDENVDEDIFIPINNVGNTFHQDKVMVEIVPGTGNVPGTRREGKIVKVINHDINTVVGTYEKSNNYGFVVPDNSKITEDVFIPQGKDMRAVDGHKVVCKLTSYGGKGKKPEGVITEILGHRNDPGVDILSMIKSFDVPIEFPSKVLTQATRVSNPVSEADMDGRVDFRDTVMVTIDGEDAKDLDDAVSLEYDGENYILGVYIADVTNYVQEYSALDKEAYKRGTSVYLVDRVIPMLPHALSNGICSLNEGEDRLALCCIMTINGSGEIIDHEICEGVVNVNRRMSYNDVNAIVEDNDLQLIDKYEELVPMFQHMYTLSKILRARRTRRGAIDFDMEETKIILDDNGNVADIRPYERNYACKVIEDFMLAANETVAEHFAWLECPFLYRTHGMPDAEKIKKLNAFLQRFGYNLKGDPNELHPKELQKVLQKIKGHDEEVLLSRLALRSMQQAKYTYDNTGHFGLAAEFYCHFTSPIRRYPDLQIHRIIKENLRNRFDDRRIEHYEGLLPVVATSTCKTERRAEELEREVEKLKKVQYMSKFLGDEFEGIISSVTGWGLYVELPNTVEGLVHVSTMNDDHYIFYEDKYQLVGERTGKTYSLGQKIKVTLVKANIDARVLDFEL